MRSRLLLIMAFALMSAGLLTAQEPATAKPVKGEYQTLQIERFDVDPQVDMSNERLNALMLEIGDELFKIKKFSRIIEPRIDRTEPIATDARALRLSGQITDYYSVMPDDTKVMGSEFFGRIKMRIAFVNAATGQTVLEREIRKRVVLGPYQLTFSGLTRRAAKELAEITKKNFF